ncbi:MAG TPA: metallophosphoesterase [Methylomusa anaerophila]|uniref:Calcineurin-like phosphoesterase superfamily domain protein n=1 Tax=Methylomusa anaerophila TaxID=1930071 RepID=A0A348AQW8_9FIRM|nr:metallophosphoesterase [Methylomusa anaerophila]BBB93466.1 calcineurin-like phosphoesterase superfamily domain protein [Methylomusa anaerophila]HML90584.1 metallophosphoesterase [Methylomusa anaerophila]
MKVFSISDIHVDFEENLHWFNNLSLYDYQNDLLILAGDVTHVIQLFEATLRSLRKRFWEVLFVPGNHDLWIPHTSSKHSLEKLQLLKAVTADCGVRTEPFHLPSLSIIPLTAWYDYSFGEPSQEVFETWTDYRACKWPEPHNEKSITEHFIAMNEPFVDDSNSNSNSNENRYIISFSHFLPRIDIMPDYIPLARRNLYPVLGTTLLEDQIRRLGSRIHVYGHSHVNNQVVKDNILYVNNAFGYPYETQITAKKLKCIFKI